MIVKLFPFMVRHLAADGGVVLAEFLRTARPLVEAAAQDNGLIVQTRIEEQEWVTMTKARSRRKLKHRFLSAPTASRRRWTARLK